MTSPKSSLLLPAVEKHEMINNRRLDGLDWSELKQSVESFIATDDHNIDELPINDFFALWTQFEQDRPMMTQTEILQDLQALETRLRDYEHKYRMTSVDFYDLYQQGLLDDEGFEQSMEFTRWASAYEIRQRRKLLQESTRSS